MAKILIIDDESAFREGLIETLTDLGHAAEGVGSASKATALLGEKKFEIVFIDFHMPGMNGVEAMKFFREKLGADVPPIVMLTAFSDSQNTIEAMRLGAFDHLTKPVSREQIEKMVASVTKAYALKEATPHSQIQKSSPGQQRLVGRSESLREVLKLIGRLASTDTSVLLTGETGTGKEVVAQEIHMNGARSKGPFIAVNCAAIPESLLESELFGHIRGSFTGATNERKGSFQLAQNGTLFLDEIGDMNLTLQAKILRAVQEREVIPVGASKPIKVDCRIIAATHQNLQKMVERHEFREDLYFRLNVVQLRLPPLRERVSDIEELSRHFLNLAGAENASLTPEACTKLQAHSWPGNIRELKNVIERAVVIARGPVISEDEIRFLGSNSADDKCEVVDMDWHQSIARLERKLLSEALKLAQGNRSDAARKLGIQRQLLYAKLKEHGLGEK